MHAAEPSSSPCAARENVVGWYSTGPKLKEADLDINALISKFTDHNEPVLVICEVQVGRQAAHASACHT